jgi:hypothetical protein
VGVWRNARPIDRTHRLVAVGSFGNPDNYVPTVWLSPAH